MTYLVSFLAAMSLRAQRSNLWIRRRHIMRLLRHFVPRNDIFDSVPFATMSLRAQRSNLWIRRRHIMRLLRHFVPRNDIFDSVPGNDRLKNLAMTYLVAFLATMSLRAQRSNLWIRRRQNHILPYKSIQSGFRSFISSTFFFREPPLICFSRVMAEITSSVT